MKKYVLTLAGSILALLIVSSLHAQMSVDSLDGPITANENSSFQNYVTGLTPAANNIGNSWAQGASGEQTKAMGLMFEATGNVGTLDQMIRFCDAVLAERNDLAASPTGQYTIWTGRIDPVWPNTTTAPIGTGGEQGDPVGHLAYCARLILQTPAIWNNNVGIGDPNGYGATYLARARTYVTQADYTMDHHILNSELDLSRSNQMWFASGDPYKGGTQVPWNQIMMFTYPLQNLAVCHAILADDPTRLANYDAIVQANVNWYFGAGTTKYTDGAGNAAYNWAYSMPGTTGEDSNHGALDVAGIYRAYQCGRYGITSAMMQPIGNMVVDVMTLTVGSYYAGTVDGCTTCTGHGATTTYLRSGYFFTSDFRSDQYYNMVSGLHITAPGTTTSIDSFSRLMFIKNKRYLAANNFALSATPSSASVNAGGAINYTVTVSATGTFSGTVGLSVSGLPTGVTATLSPSSVTTSGTSVLAVTTSTSTPNGTYPLTITGTNGTVDDIQTISVSLVVSSQQAAAPSFSPGGGSYTSTQSVTISSSTAGASIRYTTDGSTPSETAGTLYSGPVRVAANETLKAIAYETGYSDSTVTSATYTINTLPTGWTDTDIGTTGAAGSASYSGGTYTVLGSGSDIYGTSDQFNYAYTSTSGDTTITARVASQQNTNGWAKSGVMFRETTAAGSSYVGLYVTPTNGADMQYRNGTGTTAVDLARGAGIAAPYWVRLVRSGNNFTGYTSADGNTWTQIGSISVTMASGATAGLAVCSHAAGTLCTATFTNVTVAVPTPAAAPTFTPTAGSYTSVQSVTISTTTTGASIRYTTDGSTPSETAGTLYSGPVSVGTSETLKAIAYATGYADSSVTSAAYTITLPTAAPTFSPAGGTYTSVQSVAISTTTTGASIRYTTDGSTPSETAGTLYSGPVSVGSSETLKAIAYATGYSDSTVSSAAYTITLPAAAPTFSPAAGTYTSVQSVTISSTTAGVSIRYTTDGSTPSETAGTLYSGPVSVAASETLKAIAYATGYADSSVSSAAYTITLPAAAPTFSPAGGTYTSAQSVTISTTTTGASIRYTTDGSTPSETAGTLYSGPVSVGSSETLKAIAYETGYSDSSVSSATYTINLPSLPGGWSDADIGAPPLAGSATYSTGTFTVNGCGADIYGTSDQFNYTSNAISGDMTITARVATQQNTNGWAKCGVMYRETTAAGSSYVGLYVTPSNGVDMQYRNGTGTSAVDLARVASVVAPYWVRLVRSNGTFIGYISADGSTWTQVGSVNVTMASSALVGLAVCSHNTAALNTTTFDNVKIAPSFVGVDIGAPPLAGSTTLSGSTYTVNGCGADIYGTADQFQYAYDNHSGNVTITARVASQTNTNAWAKAGVMIRETTAAGASYVGLYVTPTNGIDMQYRNGTGASATDLARGAAVAAPYWLRIVRSSNTFTGYSSADGVTWTQVGSVSVTMAANVTAGLAVCSHNTAALSTATFDNLTVQ